MKKNIEFKRFVNKKADPEELKIVKSLSNKRKIKNVYGDDDL